MWFNLLDVEVSDINKGLKRLVFTNGREAYRVSFLIVLSSRKLELLGVLSTRQIKRSNQPLWDWGYCCNVPGQSAIFPFIFYFLSAICDLRFSIFGTGLGQDIDSFGCERRPLQHGHPLSLKTTHPISQDRNPCFPRI